MTDLAYLLALLLATSGSFFFSGIETGIYALNKVRLHLTAEEGDPRAVRIASLIRRPQVLISTILIGNHLANYAATFATQGILRHSFHVVDPQLLATLNTVVLTPFLFVFAEITPKNVFRIRADTLVLRGARVLWLANVLFRPLSLFFRWLGRVSRALPTKTPAPEAMLSRDQIESLVGEVAEDGVLTSDQRRMVRNVLRLSTLTVRDAMVPMRNVDWVVEGFSREELLKVSSLNGRTRLPVRSQDRRRLSGVVSVLDLVYRETDDLGSLVREPTLLSPDTSVDRALRRLRRDRQPMGFVTDRRGSPLGIVTIKDLVEEVSGDLPAF